MNVRLPMDWRNAWTAVHADLGPCEYGEDIHTTACGSYFRPRSSDATPTDEPATCLWCIANRRWQ